MKWHYDLNGAEPIIRDEPVFDGIGAAGIGSVTINAGALMAIGSAAQVAYGTAAAGNGEITCKIAYDATVNSMATNCIGIILETPYASGTSSSYSTTNGSYYGKIIINPGAVYLAEQNIDSSNDIAVVRNSTTTLESVAAGLLGYGVYFPTNATGVKGSMRLLTGVSGTAGTLDSALTATATTADSFVVIYPKHSRAPALDSTATKVTGGTAAVTGGTTNLVIAETYIDRDAGMELYRPNKFYGLNSLHNVKGGNGPKIYYDLVMKSHIYGQSI